MHEDQCSERTKKQENKLLLLLKRLVLSGIAMQHADDSNFTNGNFHGFHLFTMVLIYSPDGRNVNQSINYAAGDVPYVSFKKTNHRCRHHSQLGRK